MKAQNDTEPL